MRIAIIYYSGTGNTEMTGALLAEGARSTGAKVDLFPISHFDESLLKEYDRFAFGCPASAEEELEEMEFLPFYEKLEPLLKDKDVALFGSYSWGDGQWMKNWEQRVNESGIKLFEQGLIVQDEPDDQKESILEFGKRFATL